MILVTADGFEYVAGAAGQPNRDLHLEVENLERGSYYLFCEMDWVHSERNFVLTSYGLSAVDFCGEFTDEIAKEDLLKEAFKTKALQGGS